jgi:16S rRNA (guanine527-N7)-methyltransferase
MTLVRQASGHLRADWGREQTLTLEQGLRELHLDATSTQQAELRRYGELLLKWNRTYNLLGATTADTLVEDHLLDSLAVLPALASWLPKGSRSLLVDVGTGAGLPGLVIAIMWPWLPIVLVEPVGKKAAFLRQTVAECRLRQVKVLEARIEDCARHDLLPPASVPGPAVPGQQGHGRHFICRAFGSLDRFATVCAAHLQDGSLLFALKAVKVPDELRELSRSIEVLAVEPLRTVEKDVQRNLVVMRALGVHPASNPTGPAR